LLEQAQTLWPCLSWGVYGGADRVIATDGFVSYAGAVIGQGKRLEDALGGGATGRAGERRRPRRSLLMLLFRLLLL